MVIASHRKPVVSGAEQMIGSTGHALEDFEGVGHIHIHGETWQARTTLPLRHNDQVRVTAIEGLVLRVEPIKEDVI